MVVREKETQKGASEPSRGSVPYVQMGPVRLHLLTRKHPIETGETWWPISELLVSLMKEFKSRFRRKLADKFIRVWERKGRQVSINSWKIPGGKCWERKRVKPVPFVSHLGDRNVGVVL